MRLGVSDGCRSIGGYVMEIIVSQYSIAVPQRHSCSCSVDLFVT